MTGANRQGRRRAALRPLVAIVAAGLCGSLATAMAAPPKVQFSRQVLPMLNKECGGCHRGAAAPGGYSLESQERLFAGGRHGRAVVPGKSGESTLVKYLLGELKPQMPPGKPLPLDTIALVRRWIDEGAKIDSMVAPVERGGIMRDAMPMTATPRLPKKEGAAQLAGIPLPAALSQSAPVTALAYSPDGTLLAAGGYRAVRLLDPATGAVVQTLSGPCDQVLSVSWSSDGKRLAAAGGAAGVAGEVCLWEAGPAAGPWAKPRILKEHADSIAGIAWRPGAAEFATASPDKTVKLWDAVGGKVVQTLKDHVDAVFSVAYSPDGQWMASGSGDRTVKLYQTASRARVASFSHGDAVSAIAFNAKSELLAAACVDKQIKVWPVKAGPVENPLRGHGEGEAVNAIAFSADGSTFVWGAQNRKVRIWNGEVTNHRREMNDSADWVYAVAASPDGKTVAAGGGDGKVYFWSTADGKLLKSVTLGAGAAAVAAVTTGDKK